MVQVPASEHQEPSMHTFEGTGAEVGGDTGAIVGVTVGGGTGEAVGGTRSSQVAPAGSTE